MLAQRGRPLAKVRPRRYRRLWPLVSEYGPQDRTRFEEELVLVEQSCASWNAATSGIGTCRDLMCARVPKSLDLRAGSKPHGSPPSEIFRQLPN